MRLDKMRGRDRKGKERREEREERGIYRSLRPKIFKKGKLKPVRAWLGTTP
jgi:hypothetical protein